MRLGLGFVLLAVLAAGCTDLLVKQGAEPQPTQDAEARPACPRVEVSPSRTSVPPEARLLARFVNCPEGDVVFRPCDLLEARVLLPEGEMPLPRAIERDCEGEDARIAAGAWPTETYVLNGTLGLPPGHHVVTVRAKATDGRAWEASALLRVADAERVGFGVY